MGDSERSRPACGFASHACCMAEASDGLRCGRKWREDNLIDEDEYRREKFTILALLRE